MKFTNLNIIITILSACVLFSSTSVTASIVSLDFEFDDITLEVITKSGIDAPYETTKNNIFSPGSVNLKLDTNTPLFHQEYVWPQSGYTSTLFISYGRRDTYIEFTLQSEWEEKFKSTTLDDPASQDINNFLTVDLNIFEYDDPLITNKLWSLVQTSIFEQQRTKAVYSGDVDSGNYIQTYEEIHHATTVYVSSDSPLTDKLKDDASRPRTMDDVITVLRSSNETKFQSYAFTRKVHFEYVDGQMKSFETESLYQELYEGNARIVNTVPVSEPSIFAIFALGLAGLVISRINKRSK